jgi:hypothetical protein
VSSESVSTRPCAKSAQQRRAAAHLQLAASLLLEPRHGVEVAQHRRMRPCRPVQRRRHDIFRQVVERAREEVVVGHARPEGGEEVVGGAAEQEGVGAG